MKLSILTENFTKYLGIVSRPAINKMDSHVTSEEIINEATFTRKHCEFIANIISNSRDREELIRGLIEMFKVDNVNFDEAKFNQRAFYSRKHEAETDHITETNEREC